MRSSCIQLALFIYKHKQMHNSFLVVHFFTCSAYKVAALVWKSYRWLSGATERNNTHTKLLSSVSTIFLIILIRQPTFQSREHSDGHDMCKSHRHSNWDRALSNKLQQRVASNEQPRALNIANNVHVLCQKPVCTQFKLVNWARIVASIFRFGSA